MTKLMEKAIKALKGLPEDRQEELTGYILYAVEEPIMKLTDAERAAVQEGLAAADAGDFATDEEIEAISGRLRSA